MTEPVEIVRTGIDALDEMLGGRGVPLGSTVLIRGAPGTGKTTLVLQIMTEHLKRPEHLAVFISLEKAPLGVIEYAEKAFHFRIDTTISQADLGGKAIVINRQEVEDELLQHIELLSDDQRIQGIGDVISALVGTQLKRLNLEHLSPTLIVIDSLNLLAELVLKVSRRGKNILGLGLRDAISMVCQAIRDTSQKAVIMFTGEYDVLNPQASSVASESYSCDVDIQLTVEPVVRETLAWHPDISRLEERDWYSFPWSRKGVERRSFCRVVKSRSGPSQARRCSYNIVDGRGIEFYEAYPGDGQIMLFAENEPQRMEWKNFIMRDVLQMYLYPALDFTIFDRSGLQRTFASLRRFLNIPETTDMYLSSFDTYWVDWYVELYQRLGVAKLLSALNCSQARESRPGCQQQFCVMVGKVQLVCREALAENKKSIPEEIIAREIIMPVCAACPDINCAYRDPAKLLGVIKNAYDELLKENNRCGLLHPISINELRLFGERRSRIIDELGGTPHEHDREGGPLSTIHGEDQVRGDQETRTHSDKHEDEKGQIGQKILAVPYNANIGFIVCRRDLLQYLKGAIKTDSLIEKIKDLYYFVENGCEKAGLSTPPQKSIPEIAEGLAKKFRDDVDNLPETWEGLISLCVLGTSVLNKRLTFLIETRTFDTIVCTLLEFVWASGGDLRVQADYAIHNKSDVLNVLFRAFYLLHYMFDKRIIPQTCSLEPQDFAGQSSLPDSDWLFARHWYSTFVDVLTAKYNHGQSELIWRPAPNVRLDIMPIPVSLRWYIQQKEAFEKRKRQSDDLEREDFEAAHISCWGEWYWGIMKGTENKRLAVDLINNLMSSRKVCDRAFSCAALPTVKQFYEMYGGASCFNLPDCDPDLLPRRTFNDMRKFFKHARSRTDIFDFRHCMRELHSVLEFVRASTEVTPKELYGRIGDAVNRIENLGKQGMLFYWDR